MSPGVTCSKIGGMSLLGLGAGTSFRPRIWTLRPLVKRGFGKAKNCILLFLYGGASQLDTFDPKPEATSEIRGPFGSIASAVPGVRLSECLPGVASKLDKVSLIRSMSHPYPIHGVAYALTGKAHVDIPMELNRRDTRHWPYFGSVLDYLERNENVLSLPAIPRTDSFALGTKVHDQRRIKRARFAGRVSRPQRSIRPCSSLKVRPLGRTPIDPMIRTVASHHRVVFDSRRLSCHAALHSIDCISVNRLLTQFDQQIAHLSRRTTGRSMDRFREMALAMVDSKALRNALDLSKETKATREKYGSHLFGQSTLLARRMI